MPADETMPEVTALGNATWSEAQKCPDCKYSNRCEKHRIRKRHYPTAPALDREAVRRALEEFPSYKRFIELLKLEEDANGQHTSGAECKALFAAWRSLDMQDTLVLFRQLLKAAISAKPDADIIGKMEGLKVPIDGGYQAPVYNVAIDQCYAIGLEKETALQSLDEKVRVPVYYSDDANNLEGLEKGALACLSNLMIKTNSQNAEFMIGNEKDGEFYFTCSRTQPATRAPDTVGDGWRTDDPPKDGTPIYARFLTPMRFLPYKTTSQQFKSGQKGRWQAMNEYGGWDNSGYGPSDWLTKEQFLALSTADKAAMKGK